MQNKNMVYIVIGFVIVAGLSFYGGMKYGVSSNTNQVAVSGGQGRNGGAGGGRGGMGGGVVSGQVLSIDNTSFTVQLNAGRGGATGSTVGGGSKIVFYSPTTVVGKTVDGTASDISVGKEVTVIGATNSDGSVTAKSVQIRNAMPFAPKQ